MFMTYKSSSLSILIRIIRYCKTHFKNDSNDLTVLCFSLLSQCAICRMTLKQRTVLIIVNLFNVRDNVIQSKTRKGCNIQCVNSVSGRSFLHVSYVLPLCCMHSVK